MGNAPEELDTLGELAEYIAKHEEEATERRSDIDENKAAIEELDEKLSNLDPNSGG